MPKFVVILLLLALWGCDSPATFIQDGKAISWAMEEHRVSTKLPRSYQKMPLEEYVQGLQQQEAPAAVNEYFAKYLPEYEKDKSLALFVDTTQYLNTVMFLDLGLPFVDLSQESPARAALVDSLEKEIGAALLNSTFLEDGLFISYEDGETTLSITAVSALQRRFSHQGLFLNFYIVSDVPSNKSFIVSVFNEFDVDFEAAIQHIELD